MKPICVPCQRFFTPVKNGFYFIEGMPISGNPEPGTAMADQWAPYKLWAGDLYGCDGCGARIVSGFGTKPIAVQHQPEFGAICQRFNPTLQVNDC